MAKVLFLHGFEARPGGPKPTYLAQHGLEVIEPPLPAHDWQRAVAIAQEALDRHRPDVVAGSSRGAAVALALELGAVPLVLIAPAWRHFGGPCRAAPATIVLHSPHDELVALDDSRELLSASGLAPDRLIAVGADHRMNDAAALEALLDAVRRALEGALDAG